jgi:hypothetical protein
MGTTPQPTCALGHQGPTIFLKCEESNIRKGKEHVLTLKITNCTIQ